MHQRLCYIVEPEDDVGGFSPIGENETTIVDSSLDHYTLIKEDPGVGDILVHNASLPLESLFNPLSDTGYPEKLEILFHNKHDI